MTDLVRQDLQDGVGQRGLADAGTAGDHQHLGRQRLAQRALLTVRERHPELGLHPLHGLIGIQARPGG